MDSVAATAATGNKRNSRPDEVVIAMQPLSQQTNGNTTATPSNIDTPAEAAASGETGEYKTPREAFQMRALTRKTLSYQKRQTMVNVCCVAICPFLMVMLAAVLAIVFTSLKNGVVYAPVRYCSNTARMNDTTNIPLALFSNEKLSDNPKAAPTDVNYYQLTVNDGSASCVNHFESEYATSEPYNRDPGSFVPDSTFLSEPEKGWFDSLYNKPSPLFGANPNNFAAISAARQSAKTADFPTWDGVQDVQMLSWTYVFAADGVEVGTKSRHGPYALADIPAPGTEPGKSGLLGGTVTQYFKFANWTTSQIYYLPTDFYLPGDTSMHPDDFILARLQEVVDAYESSRNISSSATIEDRYKLETESYVTTKYPFFGSVTFNKLDKSKVAVKATIQTGRVARLVTSVSTYAFASNKGVLVPPQGFRAAYEIARISNALLASSTNVAASAYRIIHSLRAMPQTVSWDTGESFVDIGNTLGKTTYPFGLTFLLPMFVLTLVKEKEDRILIMMRMHGLSTFAYYFTHYVNFFVLQLLCSIVFVISGLAFGLKMFVLTDAGVYIVLLLLWVNVVVGLSFLMSVIFSKSRFALISTFAVVVVSCIVNSSEAIIFNYERPPDIWYIWPFFAFFHALGALGDASGSPNRLPYKMADLISGDEVLTCILFLLFEGIALLLLTAYATKIVPTEYGVPKPWYFIFTEPYTWLRKRYFPSSRVDAAVHERERLLEREDLTTLEDDDVRKERARVEAMQLTRADFERSPLIIRNIRKVYGSGKVANKDMCLSVDRNVVFGLLGPNGAGKSTLIHMMVCLYRPSSGTAYVAGHDIISDMENVYLNIGVCPQHDILWDDLTIEEHLLFYGRLRGIHADQEDAMVTEALEKVALTKFRQRLSKGLSGGEKRRLSIAIALLGDAPLVFLDEPTTGLDPEVRRTIWNIIQNAKQGKTIILTTHSMEEADMLCSRIGIMAKGVLRCVGTPLHLKRKYGRGFKLSISFTKRQADAENVDVYGKSVMPRHDAMAAVEAMLPQNKWRKVDQGRVLGSVIYEFDDEKETGADGQGTISRLLERMEAMKEELGVGDWGISQTSLEEVFLNIVKDDDADAVI